MTPRPTTAEPIAIVGRGLSLPAAGTAERLWDLIRDGKTAFGPPPPGRWPLPPERVLAPHPGPDQVISAQGGFVHPLPGWPTGTALDEGETEGLDPVFRLTCKAGVEAWRDAVTDGLDPDRVSILLGAIVLPTSAGAALGQAYLTAPGGPGGWRPRRNDALNLRVAGAPAHLLARALGVRGPAFTLDAACASSLYALKLGCDALRAGRVDAVLAGGISCPDPLYTQMGFTQLRALSPSGRCKPFAQGADGLVVGEGCGIFVLKRLSDARHAGDRVYATIAGAGLANDIGANLLSPDSEGQVRAMRAAYAEAGWHPESVDLIECHGTGTPRGDVTELESLRRLWSAGAPAAGGPKDRSGDRSEDRQTRCVIGSVKGNIGHLLTAAGAAGIWKMLLALEHRSLPPVAGFDTPNPGLRLEEGPFEVLRVPRPWSDPGRPRRGAVSAFGFGGINAHLLLEEAPAGIGIEPAPQRARPRDRAGRESPAVSRTGALAVVGIGAHLGPWADCAAVAQRLHGVRPDSRRALPPRNWWSHPDADRFPGYYIEDFELPHARFRIPPTELAEALPQQLVLLRAAIEAADDAGIDETGIDEAGARQPQPRLGVYIGLGLDLNTTSFHARWRALAADRDPDAGAPPPLDANRTMGGLASIAASRVARTLRAGGPAFTVSAEETSGLQALAIAAEALRRGEIDRAVVGAVDLAGEPRAVLARRALRCERPPEPPGEGAVAFVVERVEDALARGAHVYAIIESVTDLPPARSVEEHDAARRVVERLGDTGAAAGATALAAAILGLASPSRGEAQPLDVTSLHGRRVRVTLAPPPRGARAVGRGASAGGASQRFVNRPASHAATGPPRAAVAASSAAEPVPALGVPAGGGGKRQFALLAAVQRVASAATLAHTEFLALSRQMQQEVVSIRGALAGPGARVPEVQSVRDGQSPGSGAPAGAPLAAPVAGAVPPRSFSREACLEFANGAIGRVLGPRFAAIDAHPTRVRLPDEPLMLVDRIVRVDGEPGVLGPGRIVTRHEVPPRAWYLDAGRMPTSLAIEAGQADLFLCAFLGIDFETRGDAVYRLLDAAVTFFRGLPRAGSTIEYDIRILRFFRLGSTRLFRFEFDASIDGEPLLEMRDGCAGFFSALELTAGRGLARGPGPLPTAAAPSSPATPPRWDLAPRPSGIERYDAQRLDRLRAGDLEAGLGPAFGGFRHRRALTLPSGRMRLVHRIPCLDPGGGRHGHGLVVGEADVASDAWFLRCHFVDDPVMPGTLMYECCLHTLRVFLLRYGWVVEDGGEAAFEPLRHVRSRLRCRGQVTAATAVVRYEVHVKELGATHDGTPYVTADAVMHADERPIVEMIDLCLQLSGENAAGLVARWQAHRLSATGATTRSQIGPDTLPRAETAAKSAGITVSDSGSRSGRGPGTASDAKVEQGHPAGEALGRDGGPAVDPAVDPELDPDVDPGTKALFDHESILEFAAGRPSRAFGARYRRFDDGRFIARLPRPPFNFLQRVTELSNCRPWQLRAGAKALTQFTARRGEWFFSEYADRRMPYAVLLEVALQSCGWLAAYLGSALQGEGALHFRNLEGQALAQGLPQRPAGANGATGNDATTLGAAVELLSVSRAAQMIVQRYAFRVASEHGEHLRGTTAFGFFSPEALTRQVGIPGVTAQPFPDEGSEPGHAAAFPGPERGFPAQRLRLLEHIDGFDAEGGRAHLGRVRASAPIDPGQWYFHAHFLQDPVCPGSLGLEAFLALVRFLAQERLGDRGARAAGGGGGSFDVLSSRSHRWSYRGQILPQHARYTVEAELTSVDAATSSVVADGWLAVDGRVIYRMHDFGLRMTG